MPQARSRLEKLPKSHSIRSDSSTSNSGTGHTAVPAPAVFPKPKLPLLPCAKAATWCALCHGGCCSSQGMQKQQLLQPLCAAPSLTVSACLVLFLSPPELQSTWKHHPLPAQPMSRGGCSAPACCCMARQGMCFHVPGRE